MDFKKIYRKIVAHVRRVPWKRVFFWLFGAGLSLFILGVLIVLYYAFQSPDPSLLSVRRINESTRIYDRTGEHVLYDVHGEEKRTMIPWEKIPQYVKDATLAIEDADFYQHAGIDFKGIFRALYRDITSLSLSEGGSTITQQLVKKTLIGDEKTLPRKIKEALVAIQVERSFSKDQIFWMYLNQIPYGSNAYGIEAASQTYFGKPAIELTLAESATLAALPQAPSYYSPYGSHVERLIGRRDYILLRMRDQNFISEADYQTALTEQPEFQERTNEYSSPHFVDMVAAYLEEKYGTDLVENGGLNVITTLDVEKQKIAEEAVKKYGELNVKRYRANNAALVATDPQTGQLLVMVGSKDYFMKSVPESCVPEVDCKFTGSYNVALNNVRQPGSSFKPFAYATAFMKGFPDSTILFDVPTEFNPTCNPSGTQTYGTGPCYHPKNYSGGYVGPVTMRRALAQSLNVPAVKTLYLAGITDTVETAHSMGISSLDPDSTYGLALVLGGTGASLYDMVSAYGVFANDGLKQQQTFILKITTSDGAVLEEYKSEEERVLPAQVARMISDVLSDNNTRGPVFGYNSPLYIPSRTVAAKTGTTQNNRDGWLIGYTPSLAAGVWTGNNDDSPMTAAGAGVSAAGPMWNEFMTKALSGTPVERFTPPSPVTSDTPMLNGEYRSDRGIHTILYYLRPGDDLFNNWEYAVRTWVAGSGEPEFTPTPSPSPDPEPSTPESVSPTPGVVL